MVPEKAYEGSWNKLSVCVQLADGSWKKKQKIPFLTPASLTVQSGHMSVGFNAP